MSLKPGDSPLFGKHGGYEKLLSYQVAELLHDITVRFVLRYVPPTSRTRDQMEQAARSGTRNISEGSIFSATSTKLEMNLTNVARGSLVELKRDYAAFLRQNKLTTWPSEDPIRQELVDKRFKYVEDVAQWGAQIHKQYPERSMAEIAGNIGLLYSMVAISLIERQMVAQARHFEENGGFSERMLKARKKHRDQPPKPEDPEGPQG